MTVLPEVLLGLEEEVFITEPTLPSIASLWYLAKLLWSRPLYYYTHSPRTSRAAKTSVKA